MALEVGDLIAKLRLDAGQFTTSLKQAGVDMERFTGGLLRLASLAGVAFATVKVVQWAKEIARATEQTQHLSMMTGIAAQRFDEMSVGMARVGLSGQDLALGFRQLARHLVEARDTSSEAAAAFDKVGIDPAKVRDSEQALRAIADRFAAMPDGIDKAALAQELFGRAGARLIPILNQGSTGLDALTQKAREFGLVLDELQRESLSQLDDALDDLGKSFEGLKTQIATFVAPAAKEGVDLLTQATTFATFMFQELSAASVTLTARLANLGQFLIEAAKTGVQVGEAADQTRARLGALWDQLVQETEAVRAATEADKEKARLGDILADVETKLAAAVKGRTAAEKAQERTGAGIVEDTQKALLVMQQVATSFEVAESMVRGRTVAQLEGVVAVARAEQQLGTDLRAIHLREIADLKENAAIAAQVVQMRLAGIEQLIAAEQRRREVSRQAMEAGLQLRVEAGAIGPMELARQRARRALEDVELEKRAVQEVLQARLAAFDQQMALLDETQKRERAVLFEARVQAEQDATIQIAQLDRERLLAGVQGELEIQRAVTQTTAVRLKAAADQAAAELQLFEAQQMRIAEAFRDEEQLQRLRLARLQAEQAAALAVPTLTAEQRAAIEKNFQGLRLQVTSQFTGMAKEVQSLVSGMFDSFTQALDRAVQGVILGTNTMRQAFKQLGQSIVLELTSRVIRQGLKPIFDTLATGLAQSFQFQGTTAFKLPAGVQGPVIPATTAQSLGTLAVTALAAAGALVTFVEALKQEGKGFEKAMTGVGLAAGALIGGMIGGPAGAGIGALIGAQGGQVLGRLLGGRGTARLTPQQTGALIGAPIGAVIGSPGGPVGMAAGAIVGSIIGSLIGGFFRSGAGRRRNEADILDSFIREFNPRLEALTKALSPAAFGRGLKELSQPFALGSQFLPLGVPAFQMTTTDIQALMRGATFEAVFPKLGAHFRSEFERVAIEMEEALEGVVEAMIRKFRQIQAQALSLLGELQIQIMQLRKMPSESGIEIFAATLQQAIDDARAILPLLEDPQELMQHAQTIRSLIQQRYQGEITLLQDMANEAREAELAARAAAEAWSELGAGIDDQLADLVAMQANITGGPVGSLALAQARFQDALAEFRAAPTAALGEELRGLAGPLLEAAQGMFARPSPEFQDILATLIADLEEVQMIAAAQEAAQVAEEEHWRAKVVGFEERIANATEAMAAALQDLALEMASMLRDMGFDLGVAVAGLSPFAGTMTAAMAPLSEPFVGEGVEVVRPGPFMRLPTFQGGTIEVPDTGPALLHSGEMIIPAQEAEMMRSGGGGGTTLVIERLTVEGARDPEATGQAVVRAIERSLRTGRLGMAVVERTRRG